MVNSNYNNFDEEAELEGLALERLREVKPRKPSKKPKTKPLNSKTLNKMFLDFYGKTGYISKKD